MEKRSPLYKLEAGGAKRRVMGRKMRNVAKRYKRAAEPPQRKPSLSEEGAPKGRVMGRECENVAKRYKSAAEPLH